MRNTAGLVSQANQRINTDDVYIDKCCFPLCWYIMALVVKLMLIDPP
jgi:hypothetical protein